MQSRSRQVFARSLASTAGLVALVSGTASAAGDPPVMLQWFEARWEDIEYRAPDFFKAGYGSVWLPPPSKAASPNSVGYDIFDCFDLGSPSAQTAYGTESTFKAMVQELHAAAGLIYVDAILNHRSGRQTSIGFEQAGGYPGFWMASNNPITNKQPTDNWGDFHNGVASGYLQSEDPNGPRYDLHRGDLVALVDIAQESNNQFIRQPVEVGNPLNIPAGTIYNRPDPNNARFYPDRDLPGRVINNPGTSRNPGVLNFTIYPYNTADPLEGDAVPDNGTGLLMRWTQWMLEEQQVDGFRWDAIKHAPSWFWDGFIDTVLYENWTTPDGRKATPFSFGECVEGNSFTLNNYIRKDSFANRDALDLNGAGDLRDLVNGGGFSTWANLDDPEGGHLDNRDGFNNGSIGVNHVFSHDNGSVGNGSSQPPLPTEQQWGLFTHAYLLMRPGTSIVYHNARGVTRPFGFWVREGVPAALGWNPLTGALDSRLTRLVKIHNEYARGLYFPLNSTDPVNTSVADVLVFERARLTINGTDANVLVAANDRYDSGVDSRNVLTSFPAGTRLHELTGNAANPVVDPAGVIPEVLTVDANRRVTLTVPRNQSSAGVHNGGYVIYGPAVPTGTLSITDATGTISADAANTADVRQRLTSIPVVTTPTFRVRLLTQKTDPLDPNWDDTAVFRINAGFIDANGNGSVDYPYTDAFIPGFENFLTVNLPLFGSPATQGRYEQVISSSLLGEGYHYITARAFRHRAAGSDPLWGEFREVVYVDTRGPDVAVDDVDAILTTPQHTYTLRALDRTANRLHVHWDLPASTDPIAASTIFNQALKRDRFEYRFTVIPGGHGWHRLTVVAFEVTGNASVSEYDVFVDKCEADLSGSADPNDPAYGVKDGALDAADFFYFLDQFVSGNLAVADLTGSSDPNDPAYGVPDGVTDAADFFYYLDQFVAGCN